jgi:hypothetical protein
MDIGQPRRIIEIEPVSLPLPDLVPDPEPEPATPAEPAAPPAPATPAEPEPVRPDP